MQVADPREIIERQPMSRFQWSLVAPALAVFLFAAGYPLQVVAITMSLGSVVALLAVLGLRKEQG